MQKCGTMKEAAQMAASLSRMWFVPSQGLTLDAEGVMDFAGCLDEDFEKADKKVAAFLCSKEGALGVTFDYEYNARWLIIPLPSEKELLDEALSQMEFQLNGLKDVSVEELKKLWKQQ